MRAKVLVMVLVALGTSAVAATAQTFQPNPAVEPSGLDVRIGNAGAFVLKPVPVPPATPPQPGGADLEPRQITVFRALPGEQDLTQKAARLGRKLAETKSEADRNQVAQELSKVLGDQFDMRQKRHQEEIRKLEDQVKKLKELVEKRQENRSEIIARRMEQVVRESQGLGW